MSHCFLSIVILMLLLSCAKQTVKDQEVGKTSSAAQHRQEELAKKPQSAPQSPATGAKAGTQDITKGKAYTQDMYVRDQIIFKEFKADYAKAEDKRAFLLQHADSPVTSVQVFVARKLADYEGTDVAEVLKNLRDHGSSSESESARISARRSLELVEAKPELNKLNSATSLAEQEAIIAKYSSGEYRSAEDYVLKYLLDAAQRDPSTYVEVLVMYFASDDRAARIAAQYPELAERGLDKCLNGSNTFYVSQCIALVGSLGAFKYLPIIHKIAYEESGNIDYANPKNISAVRYHALYTYGFLGTKAFPFLEKILYSNEEVGVKARVIGTIVSHNTLDGLKILRRFQQYYSKLPERNEYLLEELNEIIRKTEKVLK